MSEIIDKYIKSKEFLKKEFFEIPNILIYLGDDELISSINGEYLIDKSDLICTDGLINIQYDDKNCDTITYVREGSYLIIYSFNENNDLEIDLRVDQQAMTSEKIKEIHEKIEFFKKHKSSIKYELEWILE